MGLSDRRRKLRAEKRARKEARMKNPGKDSTYARKLRGNLSTEFALYQPGGKWGS